MGSLDPSLNFSEDEFVQLGLLPATSDVIQGQASDKSKAWELPVSQSVPGTPGKPASLTGQLDPETQAQELFPSQGESLHQATPQGRLHVLNDKKQANREHQRRFRERRKVQTQTLKTQLAETVRELEDLKVHKEELEKRLTQSGSKSPSELNLLDREFTEEYPSNVAIAGKTYRVRTADCHHVPASLFKSTWQNHLEDIKCCLDTKGGSKDVAIQIRLAELVFETMMLRVQHLSGNGSLSQSETISHPDTTPVAQLIEGFNLSDGQKQDLMFLRRVYLLKLQELNQQQAALSAQVQNHTAYALSDFSRVTAITAQLRQNAAARYQLVHRFSWSAYFGVLTMQQSAQALLNCNPDKPLAEHLVACVAERLALPSRQDILADPNENLTEQEWMRFWHYTERMNPYKQLMFEYCPIMSPAFDLY